MGIFIIANIQIMMKICIQNLCCKNVVSYWALSQFLFLQLYRIKVTAPHQEVYAILQYVERQQNKAI